MIVDVPENEPPPTFVESRVDVGAEDFEYQLSELDDDRRVDLIVTSAHEGERTLRVWRQRDDSTFPDAPDFRLALPADVVCWSLADLRPEPGRELLLFTRSAIFSVSTTQPGLQGNLRRELALPLFPDLADPASVPCWRLTKDVDGDGREELLVVSEGRLLALAPQREGPEAGKLAPLLSIDCSEETDEDETATFTIGNAGMNVRSRAGIRSFFPDANTSRPQFLDQRLFAQRHRYKVPALLDWNGDGRLDAVRLASRSATVRLRLPDGSFEPAPTVINYSPAGREEPRSRAQLVDCDGDGRDELVLFRKEGGGLGEEFVALVYPRDASGNPAEAPSARAKLPGIDVQYELSDVDRDGRLDLLARVIDIPTGLTTLATIRLDVAFHVFRGLPAAQLSREPEISFERSFKPEQLARVQETLLTRLDGDYDGDGISDLVCTQLDGRVEIRRVVKRDERLVLEERPFSSFVPPSPVERLETWDVSRDGIADLTLRHAHSFTFFVSRAKAGR